MTADVIPFDNLRMPTPGRRPSTPKEYRSAMQRRTKEAREAAGLSWADIARDLSHTAGRRIVADTYRKWEKTALLPHDLLIPFCEITGADLWELLTGIPFNLGTHLAAARRRKLAS